MATIRYTFADGHTEEVEVTEEFKREYEFLLVREQAPHWKEMKQKERAGLRCVKNLYRDKWDSPRGSGTYGSNMIESVMSARPQSVFRFSGGCSTM